MLKTLEREHSLQKLPLGLKVQTAAWVFIEKINIGQALRSFPTAERKEGLCVGGRDVDRRGPSAHTCSLKLGPCT